MSPRASSRAPRRPRSRAPALRFDQRLVLNQWMLRLFDVSSLESLTTPDMKRPECELLDDNNVSLFYHELTRPLFDHPKLTNDDLLRYDSNIVKHSEAINARRREPIRWKYFQYLALLFTEIYLDRYFRDPEGLLDELNAQVERFNNGEWLSQGGRLVAHPLPDRDRVEPYELSGLSKIAFWMATGSGKTLLMHVNIHQYLHYLRLHGREHELNRIILLTPNEGLSRQHLDELTQSGIEAELFSKDAPGLFRRRMVEIIDVHKIREEMGEKTVAVDAFEGNNLVLVDEGHRGAGGFEWMDKRDRLCEDGFSFEYSATFGQAMKASGNRELEQEYARCILVDYSYKHFYGDGYGKDYRILNLADDSDADTNRLYLTACLLAFYQQQRLYRDREVEFRPFLLEDPLWVFVGRTVTGGTSKADKLTLSDVIVVLKFLAEFVADRRGSVALIGRLLGGAPGLLDDRGRDIFANAYPYLVEKRLTAAEVFTDTLSTLFNAANPAALHVENLKGVDGEIALRIGENEPFGLINVGNDSRLCQLCEEHEELAVTELEFSDSLFDQINQSGSTINMLIGAKKFSEGWNSWRVSTMGLLNIGRTEGSDIIQLFGRGVRLKGHELSLKRSNRIEGLQAPEHVTLLETLNVFGIRADYMRQFKEYLEEEGLPTDDNRIEIALPVINNLGKRRLKIVALKEGLDFKKDAPKPVLSLPPEDMRQHPIVVNWYPKVQAQESAGVRISPELSDLNRGKLTANHVAFMDMEALYEDLQELKAERAWHNLNLPREAIADLLSADGWYCLYIPPEELEYDSFRKVRRWEEIAGLLLRKYCDRYYNHEKSAWESDNLEPRELQSDDPNFIEQYRVLLDESMEEVAAKLTELKETIGRGEMRELSWGKLHAIAFQQHLYYPLLYIEYSGVQVTPVALNDGERDFVVDLREYYREQPDFFKGRELYLLRNQSRGRGIGFFEANNFHPDFILWLVEGDHQYVLFADPKGLRNLDGLDDPKIRLHETIKQIEQRVGDPDLTLNSCIVSVTTPEQTPFWGTDRTTMEEHHVFFQDDPDYTGKLLRAAMTVEADEVGTT